MDSGITVGSYELFARANGPGRVLLEEMRAFLAALQKSLTAN